ncbi:hypothetical protein [Methylosinus sp. PW1]|uniref:hypothetical protein n=1 Tax=Methylosinus sp. PW1 TaxID=107636 RepID=UPI000564A720|nr:hypothetical protein [Methylosinus sp. PW1]
MVDLTQVLTFSARQFNRVRPVKFEIRANMDKLEVEITRNGKLLDYWHIEVIFLKDGCCSGHNSYVMPDDVRDATLAMKEELAIMYRDRYEAANPYFKERRLREEAEYEARKNRVKTDRELAYEVFLRSAGKWDRFSYHGD